MQILVRTHHPEAAQLRETVERRARFAFRRLNALVPRADITLDDINGPRGGAEPESETPGAAYCPTGSATHHP